MYPVSYCAPFIRIDIPVLCMWMGAVCIGVVVHVHTLLCLVAFLCLCLSSCRVSCCVHCPSCVVLPVPFYGIRFSLHRLSLAHSLSHWLHPIRWKFFLLLVWQKGAHNVIVLLPVGVPVTFYSLKWLCNHLCVCETSKLYLHSTINWFSCEGKVRRRRRKRVFFIKWTPSLPPVLCS